MNAPNRPLHAVLSLLTGGLWLPVWLIIERRHRRRERLADWLRAEERAREEGRR